MKFIVLKFKYLKKLVLRQIFTIYLFIYVNEFCTETSCWVETSTKFIESGKMKFVEGIFKNS